MKKRLFTSALLAAMLLSMVGCSSAPSQPSGQSGNTPTFSVSSAPSASADSESGITIPDNIPAPVVYTGSGDDVITLDPFEGVWVLTISGNAQSHYFGVVGYDASGDQTELFVNTTEPYLGTTIDPTMQTEMLEISATGDWKVEIHSIFDMDTIAKGETYSGSGDDILFVTSSGKTARIVGNSNSNYFGVVSYGDTNELMVNTTDPYEGTVMLKGNPLVLSISAKSDWSITFD